MATQDHIESRKVSTFSEDGWKDTGGHTVRCVLLGTGYAPATGDENVHRTWSQISANEIVVNGYSSGGVSVTGKVIEESTGTATDTTYFNGDDAQFGVLGATGTQATIRWAVLLKWDSGTPANSKVLKRYDIREGNSGNDVTTSGVAFNFLPTDGHWYARQSNS